MYYTIVEDKRGFWIADELDYVAGPFKYLWQAESELEEFEIEDEEDDGDV